MRRVWALLLLAWALACGGCFLALGFDYDTSDPDVAGDGGVEASAPEGSVGTAAMTAAPAEITLFTDAPEKAATVEVKLERRDGFTGAVRLSALGLPPGVSSTANGQVITATATSAVVKVTATRETRHTRASITIHGETDGKTFDATLSLLVRASPGSLDTSFGDGGLAHLAVGEEPLLTQMRILGDDRIVLGGGVLGPDPSFAIARLTADGAPDPTFGGKGFVVGAAKTGVATGLAVVPGGLVAAGAASGKLLLVRYKDDGSVDPTLDGDKPITIGTSTFRVVGVFVKAGGGFAVAGDDGFRPSIVHLDGDGGVDTKTGDAGLVQGDNGDSAAAAIAADGTILIAGGRGAGCAIQPFPTFGTAPAGPPEDVVSCVTVGDVTAGDGGTRGLAGHVITGIISSTPAMIGYRRAPSEGEKTAVAVGKGRGNGVALDSMNRVLVVGEPQTAGGPFFVARLGTNEQVDPTFRVGDAPLDGAMDARRVGVQRDGRIVVSGTSEVGKTKTFTIARYWP